MTEMIARVLITSSVLILGIFGLRKLTSGRIPMRLRYALWLPVAVRLLVPFSVGESPFSVMNVFPDSLSDLRTEAEERHALGKAFLMEEREENAAVFAIENGGVFPGMAADGGGGETSDGGKGAYGEHQESAGELQENGGQAQGSGADTLAGFLAAHPNFPRLLFGGVWLTGFLAVGGRVLLSRRRFIRYLQKNRNALSQDALPAEFAKRLPTRGMRVYEVQGLPSPCLVGRHIYVGGREASDPQSLSHILAHEYSHAVHRDGIWAFLRSFLTAVYWFDPFVWAAAYAAKQDSELACDEAAVAFLGEAERFAYGRTLLNLLENGDDKKCAGLAFMPDRGEKGVKERIGALAQGGRKRRAATALVLAAAVLLCGCAFPGEVRDDATQFVMKNSALEADEAAVRNKESVGTGSANGGNADPAANGQDGKNTDGGEDADGTDGKNDGNPDAADQDAFEEALNYRGVMAGKDDSELFLRRQPDYQAYYHYIIDGEGENPMQNGWYLLCENETAKVSLYGLYTEAFGFRGLKTLIDGDVNTFDGKWCASYMNADSANIRMLESAEDGQPRRFVWKLPAEESGRVEIWRFYSAYRYDTGTLDVAVLTEEECFLWAKEHLTFDVDREAANVSVICDGDMVPGEIDLSAYQDLQVEDVQIVPDAFDFALADSGEDYLLWSDAAYEGSVVHLVVGIKLKGVDGLWWDGLPPLTIQIAADENSASGFRLGHPRIDESYAARALWQEKELARLREGISSEISAQTDDSALAFINPCPDYERISDWYGERTNPAAGEVRAHT
ncbi:MAG: M56 family metallopeptidase, partial [Bacteroidales bacterium]|nr:M56 family metallopeptidase [Bacteroidales bacterium]